MRVFTAVRHSLDPRFYYGGLWSANFHPALRALGHEVVESRVDLLPASRFMHVAGDFTPEERQLRAAITSRIVDEVRRAHAGQPVGLFLSYFYNAHFDPAGFEEIHRLGIPTVNFYCNGLYQFEHVAAIAPSVKFAWHTEKAAAAGYRAIGANPVWIQMAADPDVYRPIPGKTRRAKACFVGQRYADRERLLAALAAAGVPLQIYGSGWVSQSSGDHQNGPREPEVYLGRRQSTPGTAASYWAAFRENLAQHGTVGGVRRSWQQWMYRNQTRALRRTLEPCACGPAPDIAATFAGFEIVLNASHVWADGRPGSPLIPHVRLRDFEAPMCRACYLTGHSDEIAEFYEPGREIDTYASAGELVEKTRFYLAHPAEAERLREAGYQRARRDHTWARRFEQLFRTIGL